MGWKPFEAYGYASLFRRGYFGFGLIIMVKKNFAAWTVGFEFVKRGILNFVGPFAFGFAKLRSDGSYS